MGRSGKRRRHVVAFANCCEICGVRIPGQASVAQPELDLELDHQPEKDAFMHSAAAAAAPQGTTLLPRRPDPASDVPPALHTLAMAAHLLSHPLFFREMTRLERQGMYVKTCVLRALVLRRVDPDSVVELCGSRQAEDFFLLPQAALSHALHSAYRSSVFWRAILSDAAEAVAAQFSNDTQKPAVVKIQEINSVQVLVASMQFDCVFFVCSRRPRNKALDDQPELALFVCGISNFNTLRILPLPHVPATASHSAPPDHSSAASSGTSLWIAPDTIECPPSLTRERSGTPAVAAAAGPPFRHELQFLVESVRLGSLEPHQVSLHALFSSSLIQAVIFPWNGHVAMLTDFWRREQAEKAICPTHLFSIPTQHIQMDPPHNEHSSHAPAKSCDVFPPEKLSRCAVDSNSHLLSVYRDLVVVASRHLSRAQLTIFRVRYCEPQHSSHAVCVGSSGNVSKFEVCIGYCETAPSPCAYMTTGWYTAALLCLDHNVYLYSLKGHELGTVMKRLQLTQLSRIGLRLRGAGRRRVVLVQPQLKPRIDRTDIDLMKHCGVRLRIEAVTDVHLPPTSTGLATDAPDRPPCRVCVVRRRSGPTERQNVLLLDEKHNLVLSKLEMCRAGLLTTVHCGNLYLFVMQTTSPAEESSPSAIFYRVNNSAFDTLVVPGTKH